MFTPCLSYWRCGQAAEGGKPGSEGGPPGKKRRGSGGDADQEAPSAPEEEEKPVEVRPMGRSASSSHQHRQIRSGAASREQLARYIFRHHMISLVCTLNGELDCMHAAVVPGIESCQPMNWTSLALHDMSLGRA